MSSVLRIRGISRFVSDVSAAPSPLRSMLSQSHHLSFEAIEASKGSAQKRAEVVDAKSRRQQRRNKQFILVNIVNKIILLFRLPSRVKPICNYHLQFLTVSCGAPSNAQEPEHLNRIEPEREPECHAQRGAGINHTAD